MSRSVRDEFATRLRDVYLPRFRREMPYELGGYSETHIEKLSDEDCMWFLRSLDEGVVELRPMCELRLPASPRRNLIFNDGGEASPGRVTVAVEGILSAGAAARLHFEFGWPTEAMGFETNRPEGWPFDLFGLVPGREHEYLMGEAKSSGDDLDVLLEVIPMCGRLDAHAAEVHPEARVKNAHRKWAGLIHARSPMLLTFGPHSDWRIFRVEYDGEFGVWLVEVPPDELHFPGLRVDP